MRVPREEVIATMTAVSRMTEAAAATALETMDSTSRMHIEGRLRSEYMRYHKPAKPGYPTEALPELSDSISGAATLALSDVEPSARGRPIDGYARFATRWALSLWSDLGRKDIGAWVQNRDRLRGDDESPLVTFVRLLLYAIDQKIVDSGATYLRIKVERDRQATIGKLVDGPGN